MIEYIHELADIDGYINFISVGPTYYSLADINTSWLKSNELLHQSKNSASSVEVPYNTYVPNILSAVTEGDMDLAFQEFESFIRAYDKYNSSFLFLQNMYIDFINDLITHAKTHSVELDYHTANNAITAKNLSNFSTAAKALIHSFCLQRIQLVNDEKDSIKICIINYIDSHFFKFDFSLEKVASETNTNPTIIRTIVIQETGMQYKDYIVHLRLNYAKKLLLESNLSVNEICTEVGYSNASYFVKLFREKIGLTPSKYRQTYKNK